MAKTLVLVTTEALVIQGFPPVEAAAAARISLEAVAKRLGDWWIIIPAHYGYRAGEALASNRRCLGLAETPEVEKVTPKNWHEEVVIQEGELSEKEVKHDRPSC